ncbi:hypothetical protein IVA96_30485 [Bradyrhizobium sp. 159]|uniref:hypothetical protein n=1 Tax=Bradyrhizobium sp. 159 TaxID=2782632 RepID=UPI001FF971EC|nr:hypothetical protein [Bradyrhizobium sp. 159]MCK1620820.1 hypothetical protein [Bradyrhizobium sp. 159]
MRRVTKKLFGRRSKHPTLSSVRHAAAARFKATYVETATNEEEKLHGLAVVAALLGHASDATATSHYARAHGGGSSFPVPAPDPAEVARIRQRFSAHKLRGDPAPDTGADHQGQRGRKTMMRSRSSIRSVRRLALMRNRLR